jgi:hypothetical protein
MPHNSTLILVKLYKSSAEQPSTHHTPTHTHTLWFTVLDRQLVTSLQRFSDSFYFTPHCIQINSSNFRKQNLKANTQTTNSRQNMQISKFPFMPYNLLCELILISYFLFMFTATTVTMLLLVHILFLPLAEWILCLVTVGLITEQTLYAFIHWNGDQ